MYCLFLARAFIVVKLNTRTPSQLSLLVTSLLTCCSYMLGTYTLYRVTYILYWVSTYTLYWVFGQTWVFTS